MTARRLIAGTAIPRLVVAAEFTAHCNFRCSFCPHSVYGLDTGRAVFDRPKGFMSSKLWNITLMNAQRYANTLTLGFFGESMLHKQFSEFVLRVPAKKARNYKLIINTNLSMLTHEHMEALRHFDIVRLSLDAADSETFEKMRPGGPCLDLDGNRASNRYEAVAEKVRYWLQHPHPSTSLIFVKSSRNIHKRSSFIKAWRSQLGPRDKLVLKAVLTYGGVNARDSEMKDNPCNVPKSGRFIVAWDGRVSPCNLDVNIAMEAGNLLTTDDMLTIMGSPAWQARLEGIRQKTGICEFCFDAQNHSKEIVPA